MKKLTPKKLENLYQSYIKDEDKKLIYPNDYILEQPLENGPISSFIYDNHSGFLRECKLEEPNLNLKYNQLGQPTSIDNEVLKYANFVRSLINQIPLNGDDYMIEKLKKELAQKQREFIKYIRKNGFKIPINLY